MPRKKLKSPNFFTPVFSISIKRVLLLSLTVSALLILAASMSNSSSPDNEKRSSKAESRYREMVKNPTAYSHQDAHIVGEDLYKENGIEGIKVCDDNFSFGCSHGFFIAAVEDNGIGIAKKLDEVCTLTWKAKNNPCLHGIGHGLLGYLGEDHIKEALEVCATLPSFSFRGGCTSGVFMEYNFSNSDHKNEVKTRELKNEEDLFNPCTKIPQKFREACWYEMPQWWSTIFEDDYKRIVPLCLSLSNPDERTFCIQGTGHYSGPFYQYDPAKTIDVCREFSNHEGEFNCRIGAIFSFLGDADYRTKTPVLCEGLGKMEKDTCLDTVYKNPFWQQ